MSYPTWNAGTYYLASQEVSYLGLNYLSTALQPNRGNTPSTSATYWTVQNSGGSTTVASTTGITVTGNTSGYTIGTNLVAGVGIGLVNTSGTQLAINNTGVSQVSTTVGGSNTNIDATLNVLGNGSSQLVLKNLGVVSVAPVLNGGISASTSSNANGGLLVTLSNTGVTSNVAGTGIGVSSATGTSTISNTGLLSATASGSGLSATTTSGVLTLSNTGVTSVAVGSGLSTTGSTGGITLQNTGVLSNVAGTGIAISSGTGTSTISNTGIVVIQPATNTGSGIQLNNTFGTVSLQTALTAIGTGITLTPSISDNSIGITNSGVTSNVAGTGISLNRNTGSVIITNSGVTSLVAGSNVTISQSTGAVTVNASSAPVSSVSGTGAGISVTPTTGAVVVSNTGVTSLVAGANITLSGSTGAVTVNSVSSAYTAGTGINISGGGVVSNTGVLSNTAGYLMSVSSGTGSNVIANMNPSGQLFFTDATYTPVTISLGSYSTNTRTDYYFTNRISTKKLFTTNTSNFAGPAIAQITCGPWTTGGGSPFGISSLSATYVGSNTYCVVTVQTNFGGTGVSQTNFTYTLNNANSYNIPNGMFVYTNYTGDITSVSPYYYFTIRVQFQWYNLLSDPGSTGIQYSNIDSWWGVNYNPYLPTVLNGTLNKG